METKNILVLSITIVLAIIASIFIFSFQVNNSPLQNVNCETIQFNNENGINLVFISSKQNVDKFTEHFFQTTPFKENKNQFNIYLIENELSEEACEIYQDQAILCRGKEVIKTASACPNDYIFVIKDLEDYSLRSSTYQNIVSINSQHQPSVSTHEFGHALANLADEYVPAILPKEQENCVESCDKFSDETNGCFEGCGNANYHRSIENGLMRTLSVNNFGILNEKILLEKIPSNNAITGNAITEETANCNEQQYYLIEGYYSSNNFQISNKELYIGCAPSQTTGTFTYELKSDEKIISQGNFNPEIIFIDIQNHETDQLKGGPEIYEGKSFLAIRQDGKAEVITFKNQDNQIVTEINIEEESSIACKIK